MSRADLRDLRRGLKMAERAGDEIMAATYRREIDAIEVLLGEMEMLKGTTNV